MKHILSLVVVLMVGVQGFAQLGSQQKSYTHADTLRGSVTKERAWWDALHYDLYVRFNQPDSSILGKNVILYKVLKSYQTIQIDLMEPLKIDSIIQDNLQLVFKRDGNAFFAELPSKQKEHSIRALTVYFHGKPKVAVNPPWDGGVIWSKDKQGRPWISVACQGMGASVWYPCKDHQYDEPDSAAIHIAVPKGQVAVSNGRLTSVVKDRDDFIYNWKVTSPINNYNLIPYIGSYANFNDVYKGVDGKLDVGYWVLDYNIPAAHEHLVPEVNKMLKSFEYWFGPYPFYKDSYKIVDAPHLGMEHQSAIAYGNQYLNGYLNHDLSASGWGLKWDFIVVHESAHEWFANNISTKELADMWVHESFANYSETLFTESEFGKTAGSDYLVGSRRGIRNDIPIIGKYNVNEEGSGDMYPKGGNMIHMIRQIIDDDEKFRQILHGLTRDFYHQTVNTAQIENYISAKAGFSLAKVFDQYLRTTQIPVFTYSVMSRPGYLTYAWTNCVPGFEMRIKVLLDGKEVWLTPTNKVQKVKINSVVLPSRIVDRNFYVDEKKSE